MSVYRSHTHLIDFCKEKKHFLFYIFIFLIGIHSMQSWTATKGMNFQEREEEKEGKWIGKMIRKKPNIKCAY